MAPWQSLGRQIPELVLVYGATALPMGIALGPASRERRATIFAGPS